MNKIIILVIKTDDDPQEIAERLIKELSTVTYSRRNYRESPEPVAPDILQVHVSDSLAISEKIGG